MTNKYKKKTYSVRRMHGGLLLLDDESREFDGFLSGDEVRANVIRKRPHGCINQREVAELLGVSYGVLRTGIWAGKYSLPEKQESVGGADFYEVIILTKDNLLFEEADSNDEEQAAAYIQHCVNNYPVGVSILSKQEAVGSPARRDIHSGVFWVTL